MVRSKMSGWSLRGKSLSQSILNYSFSIPSHLFFHSFVWGPCWLASGDLHPLINAFKYQFCSMRMSSTTSYINTYVLSNHRERLSLIGHVCGRLFLLVFWQVRLLGIPQDIHLIDQLEGCSCLSWQVHGPPCIWLINLNNCSSSQRHGPSVLSIMLSHHNEGGRQEDGIWASYTCRGQYLLDQHVKT
jgi:hypothetical protein